MRCFLRAKKAFSIGFQVFAIFERFIFLEFWELKGLYGGFLNFMLTQLPLLAFHHRLILNVPDAAGRNVGKLVFVVTDHNDSTMLTLTG